MKSKNIPELRFPEFKDGGEWEEKKLNEVFTLSAGGDVDKECFSANKDNEHPYPIYGNALTNEGLYGYSSKYKVSSEAITITGRGDIGKIFYREKFFTPIVRLVAGVAKDGFSTKFLSYACSKIRFSLETTGIPQLTVPQVKKYSTFITLDEEEQQKIAECLSSLDALIDAQSQKIEKLKSHKKGLLQKLFPQEGQNVPESRFPEFRESGEWEMVEFSKVASKKRWSFTGGPFGSNLKSSDYTKTGVRVIQLQNIGDAEFINDYKIYTSKEKADELLSCNIYPNDIIMSKMGDPVGRACIIPNFYSRYLMCSDGIRIHVDTDKFVNYFVYSYVNHDTFRSIVNATATGSTRKRIGLEELKKIPFISTELVEQQKIADCLSSLDAVIEKNCQKLDLLKAHKKGLMQALFPFQGA